MKSAFANFSNPLIFIFLGGFALAAAMAYQGLDRWIANCLIRLGNGSFVKASLLLFIVTAGLSMWMSNTATTAMMIPLSLGVLAKMKDSSSIGNKNSIFLLLGVAYSASIGGIGTIVGSPPNGIAAEQLGISFLEWMKFGIPAVMLLLPLMIAILYWACKPDSERRVELDHEVFEFNWHRMVTLLVFALTASCWIFSREIAQWLGVEKGMDTIIAVSAILLLLYFRVVRWRDIDRSTDWGVLLLFGGGITLSAVLKTSGASLFMARIIVDTVDVFPMFLIVGAVICFVIFLTELSSNTATAALLIPLFYTVAKEMNLPAQQLVVPLAIAASCAFMLPVATPPNAIVYGTGLIPQKSMMRIGIVLNLVFVGVLTILATVFF